ncbi:MAG: ABC transporter ATP-binding protein [Nitrospinaceae bacterium]
MNDPGAGPLLQALNIEKAYVSRTKSLPVLQGASLDVKRGELLGLVGASGAGKKTIQHNLGGLDRPLSGQVLFRGKNIFDQGNSYLDEFRNQHVGFVFQFFNLLPDFTALENTLLPAQIGHQNLREARRRAELLLAQVGLKDRLHHKPGELSGGECQRVALARSLMNQPDLLLADEPTGNLDAKASAALLDLVRELNRTTGQTFVIVTHSRKIADSLDRVVQISEGKVHPVDNGLIL